MEKKKILFFNKSVGGVNYYRTETPAIQLQKLDNDNEFHVEILNNLNFYDPQTISYLKSFDIIHYHRDLSHDLVLEQTIIKELKQANVKLILDVDDYWEFHHNHPLKDNPAFNEQKKTLLYNIHVADYVTVTTKELGDEIKKIKKDNKIIILENGVNPDWMKQFENKWKPSPDGMVRITYMGGSTHLEDLKQLEGVINILNSDPQLKNKFKIILAGWDISGYSNEAVFNENLRNELKERKLWKMNIIKEINSAKGNIDNVFSIPQDLKDKYRGKMFFIKKRDIELEESVYYKYENILTDNYRLIDDKSYYNWLMRFEINGEYENEGKYARRWTKDPNNYAYVLNETDIVLAPLKDTKFNNLKSELKQIESWSRKLPIICSDVKPYNVYGKHMENCLLIPNRKNIKKHWVKNLKKLILDEELRKKLGKNLHRDFKETFNLENITKKRINLYKKILNND